MRERKMNNSFNYSGFIEMFLNTNDEFEPYGFIDDLPAGAEVEPNQHAPSPHRERLIIDPGKD